MIELNYLSIWSIRKSLHVHPQGLENPTLIREKIKIIFFCICINLCGRKHSFGPSSGPITPFAGLEVELVTGVVWEKNIVGWLEWYEKKILLSWSYLPNGVDEDDDSSDEDLDSLDTVEYIREAAAAGF